MAFEMRRFDASIRPRAYLDFSKEEKLVVNHAVLDQAIIEIGKRTPQDVFDFKAVMIPMLENTIIYYENQEQYEICQYFFDLLTLLKNGY